MQVDLAVVGTGLAGLALARAARGLSVALIGDAPAPMPSGAAFESRVYALTPGNVDFLERLGAWRRMPRARVAPVYAMRVFGDDGRAELAFDAYRAGVPALAWIAEDGALQAALYETLAHDADLQRLVPERLSGLWLEADAARLAL
ncbi:MAG TPA: ubiquinone biosynthesis protein, partial [Burkholderiales bacterium]|nr:ubiquinone biosynthesis protein [Burkholderiales bacterium]